MNIHEGKSYFRNQIGLDTNPFSFWILVNRYFLANSEDPDQVPGDSISSGSAIFAQIRIIFRDRYTSFYRNGMAQIYLFLGLTYFLRHRIFGSVEYG